jgi:multicomponent Na+:H+ antiporter subunit D
MLIWPAMITAAASVLAGLFAGWEFSPLGWARLIVEREYVG